MRKGGGMNKLAWMIGAGVVGLAGCSGGNGAEANKVNDKAAAIVTDDKAAFEKGGGSDGLTLAEYSDVSAAMRDALDSDGNDELSKAELAALPEQRRAAWAMYDTDRSGTLTLGEFNAMQLPKFTMRDRDHDGRIMREEIPDGTPAGGLLF